MSCEKFTQNPFFDTVTSLEDVRALAQGRYDRIAAFCEAKRLIEYHRAASITVAQQRVDDAKKRRDFALHRKAVQTLRIVTAIWACGPLLAR